MASLLYEREDSDSGLRNREAERVSLRFLSGSALEPQRFRQFETIFLL